MTDEKITGTMIVRQALHVRARMGNLALIAREMGVPNETLSQFLAGGTLAPEVLRRLSLELFQGRKEWRQETDLLHSVMQHEPKPVGVRPPTFAEMVASGALKLPPKPVPVPPSRSAKRESVSTTPKPRPGWA